MDHDNIPFSSTVKIRENGIPLRWNKQTGALQQCVMERDVTAGGQTAGVRYVWEDIPWHDEQAAPRCHMCGEPRDGRDHGGCDRAYPETL